MKRWFRTMSLKRRLWIAFIFVTVICLTATGTYVSVFFSHEMESQATKASQDTVSRTAQVLDERLRNIVVAVSTLMMGEAFQKTMSDVQEHRSNTYYTRLSQMQTPFTQLLLTELSIDSILIHTPTGDFYPLERNRTGTAFAETSVHAAILSAPERWNTLWLPGHTEEFFSRPRQVLSLIIKPMYDGQLPGVYVIVNVREDKLMDLTQEHLLESGLSQMMVDRSGASVFSALKTRPDMQGQINERIGSEGKGHFEYVPEEGKDTYLVNYAALGMNPDWVLMGYRSRSELLAPVRQMRWTILTIMGVCILLALPLARLLAGLLLRPLFKLRSLMFKVELNNLDVRFESKYDDEISQVGHKFNRMVQQIGELIEAVKASEHDKRKSELKALQAQIDPHFLYNTLNTIYWKSEMEEHETVRSMIVSLSLLFRLGLNNGREMTTLRQELDHVKQYLNLQAQCYEDLFEYEVEAPDETVLRFPVPKILLQPLVENSILHGFQELRHKGRIRIAAAASVSGEWLTLLVEDNGAGMDAEEVQRKMNGPESGQGGYALTNVRNRLSLFFGSRADMRLESEPGVRTAVTLVIPIKDAEAVYDELGPDVRH